ncbi:unnamed protein product [Symbiodinium sp. CCMP2592]|nr:unnamed protein product [Symbiodinium sp. CCMP2592]
MTKSKVPSVPARASPVMLDLDQVTIPSGVFVDGDTPLTQIPIGDVGPTSAGVVLVRPEQAAPYFKLSRPVSRAALALVVVGELDLGEVTVKSEVLRFRATSTKRALPLLLSGTLLQIGDRWVSKHAPKVTNVEVVPSEVLRIAVFRDQFEGDWDTFTIRPLREIIQVVPCLRTCSVAGCTCAAWHGASAPGEPEAILECWARSWHSVAYKQAPAKSAVIFNIFVRIPAGLLKPLLACSGLHGVFIEPRAADSKGASAEFRVIWLPKASYSEALLLKQSHGEIIGLARVGSRLGVRCNKADEEALHKVLKGTPFVDRSSLCEFVVGPWPFGTQRQAVEKALSSFGWVARVTQPLAGQPGGLWWRVQAGSRPPELVLHTQFGEVLISEEPGRAAVPAVKHAVLAARSALRDLCPPTLPSVDPLQAHDPWAAALQKQKPSQPASVQAVSAQVEAKVLAKIQQDRSLSSVPAPSEQLREELEQSVLSKVEARLTEHRAVVEGRLSGVETQVTALSDKVDGQESVLRSMFQEQMSRIEELLAASKRSRHEGVRHWSVLIAFLSVRVGEAAHPGPGVMDESFFTLGAINPTGLNGKHGVVSQLDSPAIYAVSETHLTKPGLDSFRMGLRLAGPFSFVHGCPVAPRPRSLVSGVYEGVGFVTSFPARLAPHSWPALLYETSRIQVANFFVGSMWLLGGVVYGYATDSSRTSCLLQALTERVVLGASGPRFVAGDFNLELDRIDFVDIWRERGFCEVQDLMSWATGCQPRPTCKGKTRKDFLFVSAELAAMFVQTMVDETFFADHAVLSAKFRTSVSFVPRFQWRMPVHRQSLHLQPLHVCAVGGPAGSDSPASERYAAVCERFEDGLSRALADRSLPPLCSREKGRARTFEVKCSKLKIAPVPSSRVSEVSPEFFGPNLRYAQWFRQLRRLQALRQALHSASSSPSALEYRAGLWDSILRAPGFGVPFVIWWPTRGIQLPTDPVDIPPCIPSLDVVTQVFASFEANVRAWERQLLSARRGEAAARRASDPSLIFRDLRAAPAKPVESLIEPLEANVEEVDAGDNAVVLDKEVPWSPDFPICVNGVCIDPVHVEPDKIWCHESPPCAIGDKVVQSVLVGTLPDLFAKFGKEWARRWQRHDNVSPERWRELISSFRERGDFPSMALEPITLSVWQAAVRAKSTRSATGLDGVSRQDLLLMPPELTIELIRLCEHAEQHGVWPRQMLQGVVTALEKVPSASLVTQFRPISVLSMVYRVWGSIRARQCLRHLSQFVPPGLLGNVPGRSASNAWYSIQLAVERSFREGLPLSGFSADLVKAFNLLPRAPTFAFAMLCGIPRGLVRAWSAALVGLQRRFRIRGSVGPGVMSSTGFPEGDALSCVAMTLVNFAYHEHMAASVPDCVALTFVDNWETTSSCPMSILRAAAAQEDFARAWDLEVDSGKTVFWSTEAADRKVLRSNRCSVALDFRDLGGHLQVSRRHTNYTQTARCKDLVPKWLRLKCSLAPYVQKVRALQVAAWPMALHAVSIVTLSAASFRSLRNGAMIGLGAKAPGASSRLHLSLVEFPLADPEYYALRSSFRDAIAHGSFEDLAPLLDLASTNSVRQPGPAGVLLSRANAIGMAWSPELRCFQDSLGNLDPWKLCCQEVEARLVLQWQAAVQQSVSHRKGFAGLAGCDAHLTRLIFGRLDSEHQALARKSLNGSFFTQDALCHFSEGESDACAFCGHPDSVLHRVFECPHFQDARALPLPCPLSVLEAQCDATRLHCWAPCVKDVSLLRHALCQLPDTTSHFEPLPSMPIYDLFTDGSCLCSCLPSLRLASWGVVVAMGSLDSPGLPLCSGLVPGLLQTAFRAELTAMLAAFTFASTVGVPVRVWSDCSSVVRRARSLLAGEWVPASTGKHADLWRRMSQLLPLLGDRISVLKVSAHLDSDLQGTFVDEWAVVHNNEADYLAGCANQERGEEFWNLWNRCADGYAEASRITEGILLLHARIGMVATRSEGRPGVRPILVVAAVDEGEASFIPACDVDPRGRITHRFGDTAVRTAAEWFRGLQSRDGGGSLQWISVLQLLLDYCFHTGSPPPVYHASTRTWIDPATVSHGRLVRAELTARTRWFGQFLRGLLRESGGRWVTRECRPESTALQIRLLCIGVAMPADRHERIEAYLSRVLPNGTATGVSRSWTTLPLP